MQDAFAAAREKAVYQHGHGGYTGTIAEKDAVREIVPPTDLVGQRDALMTWAIGLLHDVDGDPRFDWVQDKWGPAAAVRLEPHEWLFFGWASS